VPTKAPKKTIVKAEADQVQKEAKTTAVEPKMTIAQNVPQPVKQGKWEVGDRSIQCAVIEQNGEAIRLVSQRGVSLMLGRHKNPAKGQSALDVPTFLAAKVLEPFIPDELREKWEPLPYKSQGGYGGNVAFGYRADILPLICGVYMDADEAGVLTSASQKNTALQAKIMMRAFARVGAVALVDEITGYQEVRAKDALERLLEKYISNELSRWVKTFQDDYYEQLFRLRGLTYQQFTSKRPILIAKLTIDIVYDRLPLGVREELEKRNPKDEKGNRSHKHFQYLTPDLGHPRLREHLAAVTALMKASPNWASFMRLLNRSLPKSQSQLSLMDDLDDEV
jgi:hypothetical protein